VNIVRCSTCSGRPFPNSGCSGYATFINTFRCQPSDQDEVVRINVDIVEQVASRSPRFISACVHRSADASVVVNHLQWRSADHLAGMQRSSEFQAIARHRTSARWCTSPRLRGGRARIAVMELERVLTYVLSSGPRIEKRYQ
jgi:heme-degrading monooxygenase HmoA